MSRWRPLTTGLLIGGLVLVLGASVVSYIVVHFQPTVEVHLGSSVFNVRTATTEDARAEGLSNTAKLSPDSGLLMVYDKDDLWGIWMKDMKFPIDIIWLDSAKKVVYIVLDASPELSTSKTFIPNSPARYVLEVPSGSVKNAAIRVGDKALFSVGGVE